MPDRKHTPTVQSRTTVPSGWQTHANIASSFHYYWKLINIVIHDKFVYFLLWQMINFVFKTVQATSSSKPSIQYCALCTKDRWFRHSKKPFLCKITSGLPTAPTVPAVWPSPNKTRTDRSEWSDPISEQDHCQIGRACGDQPDKSPLSNNVWSYRCACTRRPAK